MLHTAHRISTSHYSSFLKLKKYLDNLDTLTERISRQTKQRSKNVLNLNQTGAVIQFRTRTSNGDGEGFDLLVIGKRKEYTAEQKLL